MQLPAVIWGHPKKAALLYCKTCDEFVRIFEGKTRLHPSMQVLYHPRPRPRPSPHPPLWQEALRMIGWHHDLLIFWRMIKRSVWHSKRRRSVFLAPMMRISKRGDIQSHLNENSSQRQRAMHQDILVEVMVVHTSSYTHLMRVLNSHRPKLLQSTTFNTE